MANETVVADGVERGTVKFFSRSKGYGFIWPQGQMTVEEEDRENVFFHSSAVLPVNGKVPDLMSGDEVTFVVGEGDQGQLALDIRRTKSAKTRATTSLVSTNVTIGIRKSTLPLMAAVMEDLTKPENAASFKPEELEALKEVAATMAAANERLFIDLKQAEKKEAVAAKTEKGSTEKPAKANKKSAPAPEA